MRFGECSRLKRGFRPAAVTHHAKKPRSGRGLCQSVAESAFLSSSRQAYPQQAYSEEGERAGFRDCSYIERKI